MQNRQNDEPRYVISVAARLLGIQTHTLRYYERIGIIEPFRSKGNIRLYTEEDITLLRRVKTLVNDMGVNLAGVEIILRMLAQMGQMSKEIEELHEHFKKLDGGKE